MTLKMNDTKAARVTMNLNIDYKERKIEIAVSWWDKQQHRSQVDIFPASDFSQALAYYDHMEDTLCKGE